MTSSVLSIWYPIYRELDRPKLLFSTLNSQLILISQGDSVLAFMYGNGVPSLDCVQKPRSNEKCEMVVRHLKTGKRH